MNRRFAEICQQSLPIRPWTEIRTSRLPGLNPLRPGEWLMIDEVYDAQMAYRDHLMATKRETVFACRSGAVGATEELLELVTEFVEDLPGFHRHEQVVTRPDDITISLDDDHPLIIAGSLVQEDFCILQKRTEECEYRLTGAVLCFPASWSLAEKFERSISSIHVPVRTYTNRVSRGVQRVFAMLSPQRPLWRANSLVYSDPDLYQPRTENDRRNRSASGPKWIRVERQTLRKLARSKAIVFGIHTWVVPINRVEGADDLLSGRR